MQENGLNAFSACELTTHADFLHSTAEEGSAILRKKKDGDWYIYP